MDPCTLSIRGLTDIEAEALTLMPACTLLTTCIYSTGRSSSRTTRHVMRCPDNMAHYAAPRPPWNWVGRRRLDIRPRAKKPNFGGDPASRTWTERSLPVRPAPAPSRS
jgi:hypothetical protein